MAKCVLDGCEREGVSGKLCLHCGSAKKFRLQYWRQENSKKRKVRKLEERKEKALKLRLYKAETNYKRSESSAAYRATVQARFNGGKSSSVRRGLSWTLSYEQYYALVGEGVCFYCQGDLPSQGVGLDRCDNLKGYEPDNVVPCCAKCNRIKGDELTKDEMVAVAQLINEMRAAEQGTIEFSIGL